MALSSRKRIALSLLLSAITKPHPPVLLGVGIARQGADAGKGAGLEGVPSPLRSEVA
jgi:hypothetical protein